MSAGDPGNRPVGGFKRRICDGQSENSAAWERFIEDGTASNAVRGIVAVDFS